MSHLFLSLGNQPFISLDWQVVAQLLNTLILFLILKKILFVKVKEFIDARQMEVDKMYADADTAMAEAERLKNIYSESIAGARDEAQRIVTDARRSAQDQADAILAEARAEAAVLREKAEADIVSEKKKAVNEIKAGKVEYRLDKTNIIHCPIGKVSFGAEKLTENFNALMGAIIKAKPAAAKGQYIKSCTVVSTMGPGVKVNGAKLM